MKIAAIVENKLRYNPMCRNSDKHLLLEMMDYYGVSLNRIQKERFLEMPSFETIRRIRQKLNEEGKYLPEEKIASERRFKGYRMQQVNPETEKVEGLLENKAISWLED